MGFFSSITGWDKSMAALNAVMGNHVMENYDHSTKIMITDEIAKIISIARYGKLSKESILSELNKESRVVQMNFVALACDNLHIEPPFKNSYWERIKNPYATGAQVYDITIEGAIKAFRKEGNGDITWPGISASFDFSSLYESKSQPKLPPLNQNVIALATQMIHCFNSYLSDNTNHPFLGPREMDAITEEVLIWEEVETDFILFMRYSDAVQWNFIDDLPKFMDERYQKWRELRIKTDFDKSFMGYCKQLGFNHLIKNTIDIDTETDEKNSQESIYRHYISEEDEMAFGSDLTNLIDKVFNQTYEMLLNEKKSKDSVEISQEDINLFGIELIGCIALFTTQAVINLRSHHKALPDAMLRTVTATLSESFGPDLLDLITRYCAYKISSLPRD